MIILKHKNWSDKYTTKIFCILEILVNADKNIHSRWINANGKDNNEKLNRFTRFELVEYEDVYSHEWHLTQALSCSFLLWTLHSWIEFQSNSKLVATTQFKIKCREPDCMNNCFWSEKTSRWIKNLKKEHKSTFRIAMRS